jgi:hypothetical protein
VNDVDAAVAALGGAGFAATAPQHGSRVTPAGERLEWTVFRLAGEPIAAAPFFIRWSEGTKHPSTASPGGCSLANLTIGDPGAARLAAALDALGVQGVRTKAAPTKLEAQLTCGPGNVTLASV